MASADLSKKLECPICLSTYTDPVTLKCGHNFCQDCIGCVLDTQEGSEGYSCPECREEFQEQPSLQLPNIVENFLSAQPNQELSRVFCTHCIHTPVPAVKYCLMCEASLCDDHLRVHNKSPKHILCDPTTSLKDRKCCYIHEEPLKYYCTEDSACICVSCRLDVTHWEHHVETLDDASRIKKQKLRNVLEKLMTERKETEKRIQTLQEHRSKVQSEAGDETERVTALFKDLRRSLEELETKVLSEISGQADRVSVALSDMIQQLEIKQNELFRKIGHIEELCNMMDSLTVLQKSDSGDLCDTEDGDEDRDKHELLHDGGAVDVAGILHTGIFSIMSGVNVQKYTGTCDNPPSTTKDEVLFGVTDLILDVNSAGNQLQISDDGKMVSFSSSRLNCSDTPERFRCSQVLSSQSFSSGRHYWEVDVRASDRWRVGMCYPSIDRRGDQSVIGFNKKSWGLERFVGNRYSIVHDKKKISLPGNVCSNRVRIDLNYEAGRISFYELCDPIRRLYTFTTTFTEPLHAGLGVGGGCIQISLVCQM